MFSHYQSCMALIHRGFSPPGDMSQCHRFLVRPPWHSIMSKDDNLQKRKNISCISIFPEKSWSVTKEDEALVVKLGLNPRRPRGQAQRLCCEVITPLADKQHVSPSDPLFWFWLGWADSQTPSPERKDIHIRKALPNFGVNNHFAN